MNDFEFYRNTLELQGFSVAEATELARLYIYRENNSEYAERLDEQSQLRFQRWLYENGYYAEDVA